jgi:hypothetical protein
MDVDKSSLSGQSFMTGNGTCTDAPVALIDQSFVREALRGVTVHSRKTNSDPMYISNGSTDGFELLPGDSLLIPINSPASVFVFDGGDDCEYDWFSI